MSVPALGFTVVPGIDSSDPTQLSATPIVAWIDPSTLGVFGYYRAAAVGGDVSRKTTSDLGQSHEEFFYNQPGVVSVLPGRRTAILLSADAFEMVLACPTVRNEIVRSKVQELERPNRIATVDARERADLLQKLTAANFVTYFMDEVRQNTGNDLQAVVDRAKARVNADVDAAIVAIADAELVAWLNGSEGQKAITAAVPEPCGHGSLEVARVREQDIPTAQSDLVANLRRLEIRLADSRITVHYHTDGGVEMEFGDAFFQASGDMDLFITVTDLDVFSTFKLFPPVIVPGATGLTGTLLDFVKGMFTTAGWNGLMAFAGITLKAFMVTELRKEFPLGESTRGVHVPLPQDPIPTRMADIKIDSESLLVLGLVCRRQHWNEFNPALLVEAAIEERVPAAEPTVHGKLRFPATEWGCPAAEFETTRTFWDTTIGVHARLRDAPLPVTVLGWQVELGNFSVNSIAGAHLVDPRPTWSNAPVNITAGRLTLTGSVNHPDPPLVLIYGSIALGHLVPRNDVPVNVSGDPNTGWKLRFRGADGNFYVRFSADVRDGDGREWHGETFVTLQGDQLEMTSGYVQYNLSRGHQIYPVEISQVSSRSAEAERAKGNLEYAIFPQ